MSESVILVQNAQVCIIIHTLLYRLLADSIDYDVITTGNCKQPSTVTTYALSFSSASAYVQYSNKATEVTIN